MDGGKQKNKMKKDETWQESTQIRKSKKEQ